MMKKPPKLRKYPDDDEGDLLMQKADVSLLDAEIVTIVPAGTKHVTNFIPDSKYSSKEFGDSGLAVAWIK